MGKFNFEDYRQPWETGPHWELKKEFIETYEEMFEEDRLLCLAQAYANVVLMNCCYPDPVMRQISELSKPLQLRKKFQGINSTDEAEISKNEQPREKIKAVYQKTGRPFKQVKFCASVEEYNSTFSSDSINLDQFLSKPLNDLPSAMHDLQNTESLKGSVLSVSDATKLSSFVLNQRSTELLPRKSEVLPVLTFEDVSLEEQKKKEIIRALGLPFIQNFAPTMKKFKSKNEHPINIITSILEILGLGKNFSFEIDVVPKSPKDTVLYNSKFFIKNCEIACGRASNKKNAKKLSAEIAINTLFELSKSCVCPHQVSSSEDMLQLFSKNLESRVKHESSLVTIKTVASLFGMNDYVLFETSRKISSGATKYVCNFFLNGILISIGESNSGVIAKKMAADLGLSYLLNLSEFEIQDGKLKSKHYNIKDKTSNLDPLMPNLIELVSETCLKKPHFILNKMMYDLSLRDGFVLVEKEIYNRDFSKNAKSMINDSASFCHKTFECKFHEILGTPIHWIKAVLIIGGTVVGDGIAPTKEEAKNIAYYVALNDIKKKYYTLKIKEEYIEGFIITRNQILDGQSYSSNVISESNIGCKMLKNMGWTGGGLGEKGIAEPIQATSKMSLGSGLGFEDSKDQNNFKLFEKQLEAMLKEFSKSENYSDLVFSKDFTKEERKQIHQIAGRLHLNTQSRGFGKERFLTVRQKYKITKLLKFLANNGGSNSKFELIDRSESSF